MPEDCEKQARKALGDQRWVEAIAWGVLAILEFLQAQIRRPGK